MQRALVAAATILILALLSRLGRHAPERKDGWRRLAPSAMHWTALVLGGALVLLFVYFRLFVGSARHDAEHQMNLLTGLTLAFGIGVGICAWQILRVRSLSFEWRGDTLAWRTGKERVLRRAHELTSVRESPWGWVSLSFADGSSVKLDAYAQGCAEFMHQLAEQRPELLQGAAQ